jgi:hypothetical protein
MTTTTNIGSDSNFRDAFLTGAARAFFVTAYADYCEEGHSHDNDLSDDERVARLDLPRPGPGEDWCDYAPPTPPNAYALAGELWFALGYVRDIFGTPRNGPCGVYSLVEQACKADGLTPDECEAFDVEMFGHYLAMQSMGHGVSWFDDHAEFPIVVPHIECSSCSFSDAAYGVEVVS